METRTIEANLTIIADALVRIAEKQISTGPCALQTPVLTCPPLNPAPAVSTTPEAHQWTSETLKAELQRRGVEIAKGTKMTTLLKFWELHKNDIAPAVADAPAALSDPAEETVTVEAAPTPEEPTVTIEAPAVEETTVVVEAPAVEETTTIVEDEEPAPAPVAADPEDVEPVVTEEPAPAPVEGEGAAMGTEEARDAILAIGYDGGNPAHLEAMRIALQNAGAARFALIEDAHVRAKFVADYKAEVARLMGAN